MSTMRRPTRPAQVETSSTGVAPAAAVSTGHAKSGAPRFTLESIAQGSLRVPRNRCTFVAFLPTLSLEEQKTVSIAMLNPLVTHASIHRALKDVGFNASRSVIETHRRAYCAHCGLGPK